jgi:hypothetical protein
LDGIHPTFTQVPPTSPRSTIITFKRFRRAWMAAENAALPAPRIARWYFIDLPHHVPLIDRAYRLHDTQVTTMSTANAGNRIQSRYGVNAASPTAASAIIK